MSRKVFLIPMLAVAFLAAPAFAPAALPGLTAPAEAATNLNSSRSNIYRNKNRRATTVKSSKSNSSDRATTVKSSKSNTSDRARATTVKSSKSNTSDRVTTVKSSKSNTSDRFAPVRGGRLLPF